MQHELSFVLYDCRSKFISAELYRQFAHLTYLPPAIHCSLHAKIVRPRPCHNLWPAEWLDDANPSPLYRGRKPLTAVPSVRQRHELRQLPRSPSETRLAKHKLHRLLQGQQLKSTDYTLHGVAWSENTKRAGYSSAVITRLTRRNNDCSIYHVYCTWYRNYSTGTVCVQQLNWYHLRGFVWSDLCDEPAGPCGVFARTICVTVPLAAARCRCCTPSTFISHLDNTWLQVRPGREALLRVNTFITRMPYQ